MRICEFIQLTKFVSLLLFTLAVFIPNETTAQDAADAIAPEFSSGVTEKELVHAENFMVVAANPHASKAGFDILSNGGNAIDAMVAVQLVLGLVEPQSSGIGGGAFLVYFDAQSNKLTTFDGRETAPLAATPDLFLDANGQPLPFFDAVIGGRSVGTPGTVKLLYETHQRYGQLPWKSLFEPAINLARNDHLEGLFDRVYRDDYDIFARLQSCSLELCIRWRVLQRLSNIYFFFNFEREILSVATRR